jgi:phenylacetate-CoA ligase
MGDTYPNPDYMSKEEFLDLQNKKLLDLLPYIANVPFYKKKLSSEGINIKDIKEISDLQKIPFTTKEELRLSKPMERTLLNYDGISFFFSSSGTTGDATIYPWSLQDDLVLREVSARCMKRIGVGPGDVSLVLAPFGLPIMWYCMITQYLATGASVIPLGLASSNEILKVINSFPITSIATLPVIATRSFEFINKNRININIEKLRHFHCGGDYLSNARRRRIKNYWNVDCYDFYGLSEIFGPIAGECEVEEGLHFAADYVIVEIIDPVTKEHVPEGDVGVAVYTTLWKKAAPLLRYWSDDYVSVTWEKCMCGCTSPRIIYRGRAIDSVKIDHKRIFAKDVEEVLLSFPEVSDEWGMKIEGTTEQSIATVYVEETPYDIPNEKIEKELSKLIGIPVKLKIIPYGSFSRENIKPRRIKDERRKTSNQ